MNDLPAPVSSNAQRWATPLAATALAAAVGCAIAVWFALDTVDGLAQQRAAMERRMTLIEEENAQLLRQTSAMSRRIDDDDALNRTLREELLGIGERAALLEQAIKRVSENRMDSISELRLNQAELLLSAGIERLRLFHDADACLDAMRLADAELARLEDARFAGVRQTLAQEIAALEAVPHRELGEVLVLLADVRARLAQLPLRDRAPKADATTGASRFETLLRGLVRVRRVSPREAGLLGPLGADTVRAVVALDLLNAEAAARDQDAVRYQALVAQAREALAFGFDLDVPQAQDVRTKLARIAAFRPTPWPAPGAALTQLVNLRHTADVAHGATR